MSSFFRKIKHLGKADKETFMLRNGKVFLEKLIKSCDNKRNPIGCFRENELKIATKNYDRQKVITTGLGYELFKGFLHDHPVSIMKFVNSDYAAEYCFNNIAFASQMNHKNVMRLIGCCLETENPVLVFEYVEYGTLADRIYHPRQPNFEPVTWSLRLKIAMEIAYGIAYLHVAFSRPIVFRNVKPSNILFQEQSVAKLFDFSYSESIPEGETRIRGRVMGTFGYLPPEYIATGDCNEKCDVYSFGMLLLELLTGQRAVDRETEDGWFLSDRVRKYIKKSRFTEIVDPEIVGERLCSAKEQKLKAFTRLAFNCLSVSADDRPTMVDVAKQLRLMHRSEM
ncbi:hypothetical protein WN944_024346 [Citrus x changshan-huyou]|uniref:Protein kinase domain-containing protein n=1 Tax=Citrus x changshan-huyou TaxID=2935761 RepID=A0AAP0LMV4_9ROSI